MKIIKTESVQPEPVISEGARDVEIRWLIGPDDDAPNFFMRQFTVSAGGHTPLHTHKWEHEVYVLTGEGELGRPPMMAGSYRRSRPSSVCCSSRPG